VLAFRKILAAAQDSTPYVGANCLAAPPGSITRVGLISDTRGLFRDEALRALEKAWVFSSAQLLCALGVFSVPSVFSFSVFCFPFSLFNSAEQTPNPLKRTPLLCQL